MGNLLYGIPSSAKQLLCCTVISHDAAHGQHCLSLKWPCDIYFLRKTKGGQLWSTLGPHVRQFSRFQHLRVGIGFVLKVVSFGPRCFMWAHSPGSLLLKMLKWVESRRLDEVPSKHHDGEEVKVKSRSLKWLWMLWCRTGCLKYLANCWSIGISQHKCIKVDKNLH